MQHIEKLMPRESLKAFYFLTNVTKNEAGGIVSASRTLIWGFNVKHAVSRFRAMTDGAEFIVV